jgi:hypothetical protein
LRAGEILRVLDNGASVVWRICDFSRDRGVFSYQFFSDQQERKGFTAEAHRGQRKIDKKA